MAARLACGCGERVRASGRGRASRPRGLLPGRAGTPTHERDGARVSEFLGLLAGAVGGIVAAFLVARYRAGSAASVAEAILAEARREAETIGRQAEIAAKEELLRRREEFDVEADQMRRDFREQEKRLEKRADLLDQKLELINRKEHEFEIVRRTWPTSRRSCAAGRRGQADRWPTSSRPCTASPQLSPEEARANCS